MKAPDKVFFPNDINLLTKLSLVLKQEGDVCYIRKDALLEWAKFVLKSQEEELAKYDAPSYMKASTMGRIDAYKVLIAKLNSL